MGRTKVINKKHILELLNEGGYIEFNSISAKPYIFDSNEKFIGVVVYKTYRAVVSKYTESRTVESTKGFGWERRHYLKKEFIVNDVEKENDKDEIR